MVDEEVEDALNNIEDEIKVLSENGYSTALAVVNKEEEDERTIINGFPVDINYLGDRIKQRAMELIKKDDKNE